MGICLLWDIGREWKKYKKSLRKRELPVELAGPSEVLLQEHVSFLMDSIKAQEIHARKKQEELLDYFTLWAHQVKTPLTASQLLIKELSNDESRQGLEVELFRIEQYANMAMSYLRLGSFHEDLVLKEEDLSDLVRETVKKYALFFIRQQIGLNMGSLDRQVVTDRKWLSVVLEQILSNAIKYTKSGAISIYLEEENLVIADTGIGIQESDLKRVFERGFSGFNGRLTQQSSGLGLYLSKTIVQKLGHELSLTSQIGRGTEVRIGFKQTRFSQE